MILSLTTKQQATVWPTSLEQYSTVAYMKQARFYQLIIVDLDLFTVGLQLDVQMRNYN